MPIAAEGARCNAASELLPLVYAELRKLAAVRLANEKFGQTLQPTALVHAAWLKIAGDGNDHFANCGQMAGAAGLEPWSGPRHWTRFAKQLQRAV